MDFPAKSLASVRPRFIRAEAHMKIPKALQLLILMFIASTNGVSQPQGERFVSISVPGESWVVRIDAPDFVVSQNEIRSEGQKYLMATNGRSNVVLSVTLEKVSGHAEIEECRSSLQRRTAGDGPFKITNVRAREINGVPVVEYLIPEVEGIKVQQGNLFACMVNEDVYIDIHLRKWNFRQKMMHCLRQFSKPRGLLRQSQMPRPQMGQRPASSSPMASQAFLQGRYSAAIGPYQQALDLEKKQPTLDQTLTRVLIDNLGMAYGITGDLVKATEVFNYGVSKDPTYPMFYTTSLVCMARSMTWPT